MKFFDAFSGYGGFHLGIERVYGANRADRKQETRTQALQPNGNITSSPIGLGNGRNELPECIGYSEIDKYASAVYKHHFGGTNYGDITTINPKEIPDFDLFVGGFPCQAFSIAGKRRGFEETRGTLIFDVFRIIKEKQPRFVLLENVKGLLSHDSGRTFKTIISSLAELGYSVEWQVLNAKNFGVPQNRERVFIIGHLGGFGGRQVFPIRESSSKALKQIIGGSQGYRVYDPDGLSVNLASQAGGVGAKTGLYVSKVDRSKGIYKLKETETSGTLTSTMWKGIDASGRTGAIDGARIRRLTPTECERLMGLPDGWTSKGDFNGEIKEISDTQRYKLCGNGVVVNVVEEIIKRLYNKGDVK